MAVLGYKWMVAALLLASATASTASAQNSVQATFAGRSASEVAGRIAASCIDRSLTLTSQLPTEVVCEAHLGFAERVLVQTMLGNAASSEPQEFYRFTIVSVTGGVRVQAIEWVETTLPFGRRQTANLDDQKHRAAVQAWLLNLPGASLVTGPRFDKNGDPLPLDTHAPLAGAPDYQAMLVDWRSEPGRPCNSAKLAAAEAEGTRRANRMLRDELSPDQGLKPSLDVADAYLEGRCWDQADRIYRGIIRSYTDPKFEAFRQSALLGVEDVRSGRASANAGQIPSPARP